MTEHGAGKHTSTADGGRKRRYNPAGLLVAGFMLVLVGTPMGISMLVDGYADQRVINTGIHAEGTVTEVDRRKSGSKLREYVTVSYKAAGGQELTVTDSERVNTIGFKSTNVDSKQTVYYDPDNPETAVILGWNAKPLDGYLVGGGFVGGGAVMMAVSLWRIKKMPLPSTVDSTTAKPAG